MFFTVPDRIVRTVRPSGCPSVSVRIVGPYSPTACDRKNPMYGGRVKPGRCENRDRFGNKRSEFLHGDWAGFSLPRSQGRSERGAEVSVRRSGRGLSCTFRSCGEREFGRLFGRGRTASAMTRIWCRRATAGLSHVVFRCGLFGLSDRPFRPIDGCRHARNCAGKAGIRRFGRTAVCRIRLVVLSLCLFCRPAATCGKRCGAWRRRFSHPANKTYLWAKNTAMHRSGFVNIIGNRTWASRR